MCLASGYCIGQYSSRLSILWLNDEWYIDVTDKRWSWRWWSFSKKFPIFPQILPLPFGLKFFSPWSSPLFNSLNIQSKDIVLKCFHDLNSNNRISVISKRDRRFLTAYHASKLQASWGHLELSVIDSPYYRETFRIAFVLIVSVLHKNHMLL